jgi:phospholipid/cholesterol/gamma-HCH transport system substrate-binding protein
METRAHYVAIGAFVLALVFLAFTAVLWLAGTQFAVSYQHYDIYFKGAVTGLSRGAAVEYNGIPVGQVSDIAIDPNNVEQIRVTVEIKSDVVIKEDAAANVETNILSGVSYILVSRGTQEAKPLVAQDGQRYPVIRSRRSTLASLSARGPELLGKFGDILDKLDDLFSEQNRQAFSDTLANLSKISATLAARSAKIDETVTEVSDAVVQAKSTLVSLQKLADDVDNSFTASNGFKEELSTLIKGLNDTSHELDLVLIDLRPGVRTFSQQTVADVDNLISEMRQLVSGLSRVAAQIERDPARLLFGDRREGYQPK